jgi:hypothetical protein
MRRRARRPDPGRPAADDDRGNRDVPPEDGPAGQQEHGDVSGLLAFRRIPPSAARRPGIL